MGARGRSSRYTSSNIWERVDTIFKANYQAGSLFLFAFTFIFVRDFNILARRRLTGFYRFLRVLQDKAEVRQILSKLRVILSRLPQGLQLKLKAIIGFNQF